MDPDLPTDLPTDLEPLAGGHSGETFLATAGDERCVVRLYAGARGRGPEAPEVDAAVLRLVRGLVPVPAVLELRRARPDGMPGLLVTTLEPGERGDLVLPRLDAAGRARAAADLGRLVVDLAGMPMPAAGGFVDASLATRPLGVGGLTDWVAEHASAFGHWEPEERAGLDVVAARAQARLDEVERTCLVHSDLNLKNVLLDPVTGGLTAVLDWEFAHAGHPATDLGNLLRLERDPAFVAGVLAAWEDRYAEPGEVALDRARCADLLALVDLAARRGQNPVADRAEELLRGIAADRDVHAAPPV